jgi:predicted peroxiredoxin
MAAGFVEHAVEGVAILLWAADADAPHRLATPFAVAAAAAALELPVEVYFTARCVRLLLPGVADGLRASQAEPVPHARTLADGMRDALGHGVRFYACSDALAAQGLTLQMLVPECSGHGGALQFAARAGDARWRALVF